MKKGEGVKSRIVNKNEYIAQDSPANALKILKKIKQKASSLYTLPERGRIVPELQDQGILIYRELIIPPWRIIYRISEMKVYVLSVCQPRRKNVIEFPV